MTKTIDKQPSRKHKSLRKSITKVTYTIDTETALDDIIEWGKNCKRQNKVLPLSLRYLTRSES